jgi:hypothetical protein
VRSAVDFFFYSQVSRTDSGLAGEGGGYGTGRDGTDEVLVTDVTGCKSLGRAYYTDGSNFLHLHLMFIDT